MRINLRSQGITDQQARAMSRVARREMWNGRARSVLLFAAFVSCCFDRALIAAFMLIVRWAVQNPEKDPVYLFLIWAGRCLELLIAKLRRYCKESGKCKK